MAGVPSEGVQEAIGDSHAPGIIGCSVVCGVAALAMTFLRLYARIASMRRLALNDWLFMAAFVCGQPPPPTGADILSAFPNGLTVPCSASFSRTMLSSG